MRNPILRLLFYSTTFFMVLMLLLASRAFADPVATTVATQSGWSMGEVMALVSLVLSAALTLLEAGRAVLHFTAPRTKATWDDRWAGYMDRLHDRLASIESRLPAPPTKPPLGPVALLAIMLGVSALAGASSGCTHEQRVAAPHALVDCTIANVAAVGATVIAMNDACGKPGGGIDWSCVGSKALVNGVQIGGCAFLEMLHPTPPSGAVAIAAPMPPDPAGLAAFEDYRARAAGGATFHTAAGDR